MPIVLLHAASLCACHGMSWYAAHTVYYSPPWHLINRTTKSTICSSGNMKPPCRMGLFKLGNVSKERSNLEAIVQILASKLSTAQ